MEVVGLVKVAPEHAFPRLSRKHDDNVMQQFYRHISALTGQKSTGNDLRNPRKYFSCQQCDLYVIQFNLSFCL